jgi:hypothetical protein
VRFGHEEKQLKCASLVAQRARAEVIAKYRAWLSDQPDLMAALPELRNRDLRAGANQRHDLRVCPPDAAKPGWRKVTLASKGKTAGRSGQWLSQQPDVKARIPNQAPDRGLMCHSR